MKLFENPFEIHLEDAGKKLLNNSMHINREKTDAFRLANSYLLK